MIPSPTRQTRQMVPRWRSLQMTSVSRELATPQVLKDNGVYAPELLLRLANWRREHSILTAAELVETAIVEQQEAEALHAAQFLLGQKSSAMSLVKIQAATVLRRLGQSDEITAIAEMEGSVEGAFWRRCAREYPEDPIAWVELSLAQTVSGHLVNAKKSMAVALHLAGANRHVSRSAARLYLRDGDPERARNIILRNPNADVDPWLMASEIALASIAKQKSRLYRRGLQYLDRDKLVARQITELAGALATLEFEEGNRKKAKRHFAQSLLDPNGNALAQAEWAQPSFGGLLIRENQLQSVEEPFEAQAFHEYHEGRFSNAVSACERWARVEPYAVRPYEFGSTAACVAGDYMKAMAMAEKALVIRPENLPVRCNLTFALAAKGLLEDARKLLSSMPKDMPPQTAFICLANAGLIALKSGDKALGFQLYEKAISGFDRIGQPGLSLSAKAYLTREAALADYIPDAQKLIDRWSREFDRSDSKPDKHVFNAAKMLVSIAKPMDSKTIKIH